MFVMTTPSGRRPKHLASSPFKPAVEPVVEVFEVGDRVILDKKADEAKSMFGSEERDRALFERDDNREPGAHILNRSFSGTY